MNFQDSNNSLAPFSQAVAALWTHGHPPASWQPAPRRAARTSPFVEPQLSRQPRFVHVWPMSTFSPSAEWLYFRPHLFLLQKLFSLVWSHLLLL